MKKTLIHDIVNASNFSLAVIASSLILISCEQKGPAEKMGEDIDEAAKEMTESLNHKKPKGPMEKAEKNFDKAGENFNKAAKDFGNAVENISE